MINKNDNLQYGTLYKKIDQLCIQIIPHTYKTEIVPELENKADWKWSYFLLGAAVLSVSFLPVENYVGRKFTDNGSGSCGSGCGGSCSSGNSCGSSCGGSCGGCGGD